MSTALLTRREFIVLVSAAGTTWPLTAHAQPSERPRRIGMLLYLKEGDPEAQRYVAALLEELRARGWVGDRNLRVDYRWTGGDADRIQRYAEELVALKPDVILTAGGSYVGPVKKIAPSVPIVFVQVSDAVGGGLVESLAHPGGNATGITNFEFDISAKWLELLKTTTPGMTRTAVLRDPANPSGTGQFGAIQVAAHALGVEVSPVGLHDAAEIERGVNEFARRANGGLIITPSALAIVHRELIVALAARHRLPAMYPFRYFTASGGLMSYGPDVIDQYRGAARYIDRILRGEKPANLPVEQSTKVALVVNLRTARALGLTVPESVLARADEVIR